MERFSLKTSGREMLMDITSKVRQVVAKSGVKEGLCVVFVPHTTAGVTINENADPSVKTDIRDTLVRLVPEDSRYQHMEGNADSHVKASLMGSSVTVIVEHGALQLGTWQGVQFCEFDGPRNREVWVKMVASS